MNRCLVGIAILLSVVIAMQAKGQLFERTDPQREIELGRQAAAEVEARMHVSRDPAMQERVRRIGSALVHAMPEKAYPYEFKVLEVRDFNAFCLPGGFMYVYEGLLTRLPDDDAVAFVMAHEITHAAHRHWRRMVEKMRGPLIASILAGTLLGSADVAELATTLISAQYSREQEQDADKSGAELMWAAGYDPQGAVRASQEMEKLEKDVQVPTYLRDHPPAKDRVKAMEALAASLASRPRPESAEARRQQLDERALVGELPAVTIAGWKWLPLRAGNWWEYSVRRSDADARAARYAVAVRARVPTSRGDVWRMECLLPGGNSVVYQAFTTAKGVWRRNRPRDVRSPWHEEYAAREDGRQQGSVWAVIGSETVTTPCGTFPESLHLRAVVADGPVDVWFAAGVGMVKRVSQHGAVVELLSRYHLAGLVDQVDDGWPATK